MSGQEHKALSPQNALEMSPHAKEEEEEQNWDNWPKFSRVKAGRNQVFLAGFTIFTLFKEQKTKFGAHIWNKL